MKMLMCSGTIGVMRTEGLKVLDCPNVPVFRCVLKSGDVYVCRSHAHIHGRQGHPAKLVLLTVEDHAHITNTEPHIPHHPKVSNPEDDRTYNEEDFQADRDRLNKICEEILFQKGADYATPTDRLANFRKSRAVSEARQVWGVLFEKHFNAVMRWVRDGRVDSEPLESRFADLRNYIDLGYALFCEEERLTVLKEKI